VNVDASTREMGTTHIEMRANHLGRSPFCTPLKRLLEITLHLEYSTEVVSRAGCVEVIETYISRSQSPAIDPLVYGNGIYPLAHGQLAPTALVLHPTSPS